jgi:hypothetical protein
MTLLCNVYTNNTKKKHNLHYNNRSKLQTTSVCKLAAHYCTTSITLDEKFAGFLVFTALLSEGSNLTVYKTVTGNLHLWVFQENQWTGSTVHTQSQDLTWNWTGCCLLDKTGLYSLMFVPCIIRHSRNNQHYALTVPLLYSIYWLLHVSAVACHHQGAS